MTPIMILPAAAAATCQSRRNTYLPGTIRELLQITADMDGSRARAVSGRWRITNIPPRRQADQARGPLAVCTRTDHLEGSTHPNLRPSCRSWVNLLRKIVSASRLRPALLADCGAFGFDGEDAVHPG
jgi:hypothetical protein